MKVLSTPAGVVLTFPCFVNGTPEGEGGFMGLDGKLYAEGIVKELPDATVKHFTVAATKLPIFEYMESNDFMRDLRWIGKRIADAANGSKILPKHSTNGYGLDPASLRAATPNYAEGLKVGVTIAVGPNISPKAFMNARGVVQAVNGTKVSVKMDEGDLNRVKRATGKQYAPVMNLPKASVEVVA